MEKRAQHAKELQIQHFNRSALPLPPLAIGDSVIIQDHKSKRWSTPGVIVEVGAVPGLPRENASWSVVPPQSAFSSRQLPPDSAIATSREPPNYGCTLPAAWSGPSDSAFNHSPSFASPCRQDLVLAINVSFLFICVSRSFSFESISSYVSFETRSYLNSVITPYLFSPRVLFCPCCFFWFSFMYGEKDML